MNDSPISQSRTRATMDTSNRKTGPPTKKMRLSPRPSLSSQSQTVDTLSIKGMAKFALGDLSKAEEYFSEALNHVATLAHAVDLHKIFTTRLDADENMTKLKSRNHTSTDYDEGMRAYNTALPLQESGRSELVAPTLSYNIAQTHLHRRQYTEAKCWFHTALVQCSMDNQDCALLLVKIVHGIGYCNYRGGDTQLALQSFRRALMAVEEFQLGPIHEAAARNCVGVVLFNQRNTADDAMVEFSKSVICYKSVALSEATEIAMATVLNNMGRVAYIRSQFKEALQIYQDSLRLRKSVLGGFSINVAATVYNMGQTYQRLHDYDEALKSYKTFVEITQKVLGDKARDVALAYNGISEIYLEKKDLKMARDYAIQSLEIQQAVVGPCSRETATTLNKLGNICYEMKDYTAAMQYYQNGLIIERKIYKPGHRHITITMTNIAHIYKQLGKHSNALAAYKHVYEMHVKNSGRDSLVAAESMSSIGLMEYYTRDYSSSFESYQEALRIRRQKFGTDDHSDIASTLNSIGLVLFKQDLFDLAKECFMESLRIRRSILGKDHRDVAILWYNIATIHFETGEEDVAIQMYKETLRVERLALGEDHPDVILTLQHLGQVHQQLGHTESGLEYFKQALQMEMKRENPRSKSMGRILNLLGNAYLQLGMTQEMMESYIEASRIFESEERSEGDSLVIAGYNLYGLSRINPPCAQVA